MPEACFQHDAKAEWTRGEANPRFIVTSLDATQGSAAFLYEDIYCARGDMENRIKECQLDLYADRTPATTMRANQLCLWFASMAYVLVCALRRIALAGTRLAAATCGTIRLKLLKIGAQVTMSVRRVKVRIGFGVSVPGHLRRRLHPVATSRGLRPPDPPPATEQEKPRGCTTRSRGDDGACLAANSRPNPRHSIGPPQSL
jgi:Transposase DDE domain group 1